MQRDTSSGKDESQFFVDRPVSSEEEKQKRSVGLFRRGKTNQPPLVRAHPFSAPLPSFVGQRPDRARNIESTRIPLPPLTRQGLELFSDFHISIYLPPPKLWWNTQVVNPRSFVRADLSD